MQTEARILVSFTHCEVVAARSACLRCLRQRHSPLHNGIHYVRTKDKGMQ